jgi:hypothetical protein
VTSQALACAYVSAQPAGQLKRSHELLLAHSVRLHKLSAYFLLEVGAWVLPLQG